MAEAPKLKKRKRMASVDLLSKLPEDLLVKILSRIPTKDAMATMILSKRWRSIWRNLPCLKFKINDENYNNFGPILDKSLLQGRNFLETLSIKLGVTAPCPADFDMGKYVEKAINRKVVNLKLHLHLESADPIRLPNTLYTCKTLVTLSLGSKILLEDLSSSESSLPCLKTLKLTCLTYKDDESIVSLLSSCPVLEVLIVQRWSFDNVKKFMVKVSSLREFSYCDDNSTEEGDRDLVMDTPSLKKLKLESWGIGSSCKNQTKMPLLHDAFIEIMNGFRFPDDNFLKSMESLITLHMFLNYPMVSCCNTVKFSRLKECKIFVREPDWLESVTSLLANSPKLKKLSIEHERGADDICWPVSWKQPNCVPECLWSHFEVLEWEEYGASKVEKQFITYILENSICLKTVEISTLLLSKTQKKELVKDLESIFRVSTTSHLEIAYPLEA